MNESLRWKLVLGCLLIAGLEVPEVALQLLQDLGGPYRPDQHPTARLEAAPALARPPAILVAALELPRREASLPFLASGARAAWECAPSFPSFMRIRSNPEEPRADDRDDVEDRRAIQLAASR